MTHDPLCPHDYTPYHLLGENSCQCDLITKVRAAERDRCIDIVWNIPNWHCGCPKDAREIEAFIRSGTDLRDSEGNKDE